MLKKFLVLCKSKLLSLCIGGNSMSRTDSFSKLEETLSPSCPQSSEFQLFLFLLGKFCFFNLINVVSCKTIEDIIRLFLECNGYSMLEDMRYVDSQFYAYLKQEMENENTRELYLSTLQNLVVKNKPCIAVDTSYLHPIVLKNITDELLIKTPHRKPAINILTAYIDFHLEQMLFKPTIYEYPMLTVLMAKGPFIFFENQEHLLREFLVLTDKNIVVIPEVHHRALLEHRLSTVKRKAVAYENNHPKYTCVDTPRTPPWLYSLFPYTRTIIPDRKPGDKYTSILGEAFLINLMSDIKRTPLILIKWLRDYYKEALRVLTYKGGITHPAGFPFHKEVFYLDDNFNIASKTVVYGLSRLQYAIDEGETIIRDDYYFSPYGEELYPSKIPECDINSGLTNKENLESYLKEESRRNIQNLVSIAKRGLRILDFSKDVNKEF